MRLTFRTGFDDLRGDSALILTLFPTQGDGIDHTVTVKEDGNPAWQNLSTTGVNVVFSKPLQSEDAHAIRIFLRTYRVCSKVVMLGSWPIFE
jgi:hypothetical protein